MYLIDANVFLEVLFKRQRWVDSLRFLERVKRGEVGAYVLQFDLHGISAILGKPELVKIFLGEVSTWRGLEVVRSDLADEVRAAEVAEGVGLDFDDGLHYFYAKRLGLRLVSFDKDFDKTDLERVEPGEVVQ
ncbi:MAG: type II toxin-antitoxin system VapC family toxin [Pyrobaculum sp.]|uniref:type II toxin-antitoxin system VapC family toxin n=1 Tax=Pyrobaculum sp. 3827-6 TaxID=2983604 RepID=UPI0021D8E33F|nr:PIN domain-containing protein [Pyrobaculum sp. 3827-6]MCU7787860.1 PIN domain-containing protein [Pyrobaculum sp. 3827-6]